MAGVVRNASEYQCFGYDDLDRAVTTADGVDYTYDDVGNMTQADDGATPINYTYDDQNRLTGVDFDNQAGDELSMIYDADGTRVSRTYAGVTTTSIGGLYEVIDDGETTTTRTHYTFAGDHIAVRTDDGATDTITYLFGDQVGSVSVAYTPAQNQDNPDLGTQRYYPYGQPRGTAATLPSDHTYTGQIDDPGELMYYRARYYQPSIGRFTQPDTIIPDPGNSQDYNRYMYVAGNPINATDPSGHIERKPLVHDGGGPSSPIERLGEQIGSWFAPIDPLTAQLVFDQIAANEDIYFDYPYDGCDVRAVQMSDQLDDYGVPHTLFYAEAPEGSRLVAAIDDQASEYYTFHEEDRRALRSWDYAGSGRVDWGWHMVVSVRTGGTGSVPQYIIFDPALFDEPVVLDSWLEGINLQDAVISYFPLPPGSYRPDESRIDTYEGYGEEEARCLSSGYCAG